MDIKAALRALTEEIGVSGDEFSASAKAAELLSRYAQSVSVDDFGSVTGFVKCGKPNAKTLLLDAHIDRVGLIVTYIDDNGFLSVGTCGSPDIKTYLAQSVTVHGRRAVRGVVSTLPPHVSKNNKAPEIGDISVDVGMTKEQAEDVISPGDRVTVNSRFRELCGGLVSAPAIDDRSGVCAILEALDMLRGKPLKYDLAICFSAQEETGERGAKQAAFRIRPDEALIVDVSFGRTPDSDPKETARLGSGVMIGFSACLDKEMSNTLRELAKSENIPFTEEIMPTSTGTNADAVGVVGKGARCCTLSFPIRYMHTPVETVDLNDISATAKLIAAYAGGEPDD